MIQKIRLLKTFGAQKTDLDEDKGKPDYYAIAPRIKELNGVLTDEMVCATRYPPQKQRDPYLVIVLLSTMTDWSSNLAEWVPDVNVIAYKGNPAQRRALQNEIRMGQFRVLLTTYEYAIKARQS